jgi:uncharacterized membrane protein
MRTRTASLVVLGLAAAGLAASIYLTVAHYTSPRLLACGSSGLVNCERVTTSRQSTALGIPVAVLGSVFFATTLAISIPSLWDRLRWVRLLVASVGMAFVVWLVYAEIAVIGAICLWCTFVHLCTFGIFVIVLFEASRPPQP